ncbi:MAG: hypothetical protein AB7O38_02770, partial [Pirellulaceae bacterium]
LAAVGCLAAATGCAGARQCERTTAGAACDVFPFVCQVLEPYDLRPDLSQLVEAPERGASEYCRLGEGDVACLAAYHSALGNLWSREGYRAACQDDGCGGETEAALSRVLGITAIHARNEDAAAAAELFLRLVAAESGARSLERGIAEYDELLEELHRREAAGMVTGVSRLETEQQQLDVRYRHAELQTTVYRLNAQLAAMLHIDLPPSTRFWPECDLTVWPDVPTAEDAVLFALATRADVAAARQACQECAAGRTAAAEWMVGQVTGVVPGLASGAGPRFVFSLRRRPDTSGSLCEQLSFVVAQRERSARQETLQAVENLTARLIQVDLRRKKLALAQQRLQSLSEQQELTAAMAFQVRKARLDLLTVEQELLQEVVEWKVAGVQLKRAQGLLALECGYDARCVP